MPRTPMHLGTFRGPSGGPGAFSLTHPPRGLWGPPEFLGTSHPGDPRWGCRGTEILGPPGEPPEASGRPQGSRMNSKGPRGAPRAAGPHELRGPPEASRRVREGPRVPSPSPFPPPSLGDWRGDGGQDPHSGDPVPCLRL